MKCETIGGVKTATVKATVIGDVQITEHDDSSLDGLYLSVEQDGEVVIDVFMQGALESFTEDDVRDELAYIYA